jgi:hypothetical protein
MELVESLSHGNTLGPGAVLEKKKGLLLKYEKYK